MNAIYQTEKKLNITENNFTDFILDRIDKIDFKSIKQDVKKILFDINELNFIDKEFIISLCKNIK